MLQKLLLDDAVLFLAQYVDELAVAPGAQIGVGAQQTALEHVCAAAQQDNLRLAIAVQEKLETQSPTLMRPITLLNYRYNQFAAPGSLLVEVGAAGNSLEEALQAARLFGRGFAETILGQ